MAVVVKQQNIPTASCVLDNSRYEHSFIKPICILSPHFLLCVTPTPLGPPGCQSCRQGAFWFPPSFHWGSCRLYQYCQELVRADPLVCLHLHFEPLHVEQCPWGLRSPWPWVMKRHKGEWRNWGLLWTKIPQNWRLTLHAIVLQVAHHRVIRGWMSVSIRTFVLLSWIESPGDASRRKLALSNVVRARVGETQRQREVKGLGPHHNWSQACVHILGCSV